MQKSKLKESAKNYNKTKKLIQTCKDNLEKYVALINTIEKDVSGNNSREREAQKILANRKRDVIDYKQRLNLSKENRKSELYGPGFKRLFKKSELKYLKEQLQKQIDAFNLEKAKELNELAEKFIKENLAIFEEILAKAIAETGKMKISTDKFENLSKILSQEIGDLILAYKGLKAKRADSISVTDWILSWGSWGTEKAFIGVITTLAGYATTKYILPLISELYSSY